MTERFSSHRAWPTLALCLLLTACGQSGQTSEQAAPVKTPPAKTAATAETGPIQISYRSRLEPIELNRIHSWEIEVRTAGGDPIEGATIDVSGGMPVHNHGMPTAPRVTQEIGAGRYLLEGMKFQMGGRWVLEFEVQADGQSYTQSIELHL